MTAAAPGSARSPLARLTSAIERFLQLEAASGILLILAGFGALAWANSPWAESYHRLWQTPLGVRLGELTFERSLLWVVNDGLMAVFFFVVGLEIRRELHDGELSAWRRAALPVAAALGGVVVPVAIYLALAGGAATRAGWGVPMATDIAFAVGILTLLGNRVPAALRVLLLAIAVIDDLAAILVIAVFYAAGISPVGLVIAMVGLAAVVGLRRLDVRSPLAYVAPAVVVWAGIYAAGLHPTIAGVILGLLTPVRAPCSPGEGLAKVRATLPRLGPGAAPLSGEALAQQLRPLRDAHRDVQAPATTLLEALHPWVAYGIMPVFALANAGVSFSGAALDASAWTVAVAVTLALLLGKPAGVLLASWLALRLRIGALPEGLTGRHLLVLGAVTGVGFTMALFIAQLALGSPEVLGAAKTGVLVASAAAALLALLLGRVLLSRPAASGVEALQVPDDPRGGAPGVDPDQGSQQPAQSK